MLPAKADLATAVPSPTQDFAPGCECTPGIWLRFLLSFLVVLEALTPLKDRLADAQARVADLRGHL